MVGEMRELAEIGLQVGNFAINCAMLPTKTYIAVSHFCLLSPGEGI
jgi:hypothetical protein